MSDIPREVRRFACQLRRLVEDYLTGHRRRMVRGGAGVNLNAVGFAARVNLEQPILTTGYVQAKIHNIGLAIDRLNNLPVPPGGIFSFWHVVGRPTAARGFRPGRSLLGGELRPDYGGGLCQLSGLIYHASLVAGLTILERHPHSRDIYDDQTRYAPLGSDATVAYGFKDLRVLNSYSFPICFRVSVTQEKATCQVCSMEPIEPWRVEFAISSAGNGLMRVETRRGRNAQHGHEVVNVSDYRRLTVTGREHAVSSGGSH